MQTLDQQLLDACQYGDVLTVEKILQQGANPRTTDYDGQTALHYAVAKKNHDIARYLLTQLQLDPNSKDKREYTPFLIAAINGDIKMLQLLVQHGANPCFIQSNGWNALHYAVKNRQHSTVQYLITQLKLDPNTPNDFNFKPFMIAAENGDIDMIKLLVQLGANPHITDRNGRTALHYAVKKRHHQATEYLITQLHLDPNAKDDDGTTSFLIAAENGDVDMLRLLIQHGANPYTIDREQCSAIHKATHYLNRSAAQYLITQIKLNPNTKDRWGRTPFLIAAEKGDINMLRLLIQLGANHHATDHEGRSALHYAVEKRHYKATQYLIIQLNLDPNTQDHKGITPFMIATQNSDIKMLYLLTQLGANPYATDDQGRNALHYVTEKKKHHTAQYLIIHLDFDPNSQDDQGNTPLLIAIQNGYARITKNLIQLGANPYIPNHQGQTPTSIARRRRIPLEKPQPSTITL